MLSVLSRLASSVGFGRRSERVVARPDERRPMMESVESRMHLSTVTLPGTGGVDQYKVIEWSPGVIDVYTGSGLATLYGSFTGVTAIEFTGLAGADYFDGTNIDTIGVTFEGNLGADQFFGGEATDYVYGGEGQDYIDTRGGSDVVQGGPAADTILGGTGQDNLNGNAGGDFIYGEGDNDLINGGEDNDTIDGGTGTDLVYGEDGVDTFYMNDGVRDNIYGGNGVDIYNTDGLDVIFN